MDVLLQSDGDCTYPYAERWLQRNGSTLQRVDEFRISVNAKDGTALHQRAISEHSRYATDTGRLKSTQQDCFLSMDVLLQNEAWKRDMPHHRSEIDLLNRKLKIADGRCSRKSGPDLISLFHAHVPRPRL
jgi:hypothetical protein